MVKLANLTAFLDTDLSWKISPKRAVATSHNYRIVALKSGDKWYWWLEKSTRNLPLAFGNSISLDKCQEDSVDALRKICRGTEIPPEPLSFVIEQPMPINVAIAKRRKWYVVVDDGIQEKVYEYRSRKAAVEFFENHQSAVVLQLRSPLYRIVRSVRGNNST